MFVGFAPFNEKEDQADGLALSCSNPSGSVPKVCSNLRTRYKKELGIVGPNRYNLDHWAREGVLLMNACLTCRIGEERQREHLDRGWAYLTYQTIVILDTYKRNCPFVFFGYYASSFSKFVKNNPIFVLPSPANNSFFRNTIPIFSSVNEALLSGGVKPIEWKHPFDMYIPKDRR